MSDTPDPIRPRTPFFLGSLTLFCVMLGYALFRWDEAKKTPLREVDMGEAVWIRAAGENSYSGVFRKEVFLPSSVKHGWLVVSACDAFEVSVNTNPLDKIYLWRPTRPFQSGMSAAGQRMTSVLPSMAMNFPREYQWDGHDSYRLPTYIDLTKTLQQGENAICVEVESRRAPARVVLRGQITLWSGEQIDLKSDMSWLGESVPPGIQPADWRDTLYDSSLWRKAQPAQAPSGKLWSTVPTGVFTEPFRGEWMQSAEASSGDAVCFHSEFQVDSEIDQAWIRVVANRRYDLFINEHRVIVDRPAKSDIDLGEWIFGRQSALDPVTQPELLDPDEVGTLFPGKRFESPRRTNRKLLTEGKDQNEERRVTLLSRDVIGTVDVYNSIQSEYLQLGTPEEDHTFPDRLMPKSLARDRSEGGFLGYDIARLIKVGRNQIELRCAVPASSTPLNWTPTVAVDGCVTLRDGSKVDVPPASDWLASNGVVESKGPAISNQRELPGFDYRGEVATFDISKAKLFQWVCCSMLVGFPSLVLASFVLPRLLIAVSLVVGCTSLGVGFLLESTYSERHERLVFEHPSGWAYLVAGTLIVMFFSGVVDRFGQTKGQRLRARVRGVSGTIINLPDTRLWRFLILWVLMLCALLRGYKLDYQPLDDDEYASTQAVLAIAETGVPGFEADKVYYTRSPLFHYLTAAIAWPFGLDLWTLRLQSVAWSVATAWLAYICGSRLLMSPWVGFGAMVLITLHPFEIYTGHVIRFYQMQQFFALLTVYMFCRGFVDGKPKYRYLTIGVFLAAVLSQEISAVMGVSLAIGYFLFGKDLGWHHNIRLITLSGVAVIIIVLDFLVFQTRCLTRVEGISPNLEASVKPHFWKPYNFLALYIGYSRLHLLLSAILLLGLPLSWRQKSRHALALHFFLISGVVMTNLLITHISLRYQYWLFPIWMLLGLDSARLVVGACVDQIYDSKSQTNRHLWNTSVCVSIVFIGVVLSWSPWRIPGSYETKILGDSTGAFRYVNSQLRSGDQVAATEPHTHAGFLEARIDYDISIPLLYDFAILQDGKLVDRNGGAEVVGSLDGLMDVLAKQDRVWLLLNREKFRTRGKNLRWEYPGARFELFLRKNCELKHRTYLWSVYLWDASRGLHIPFRNHSG